MTLYGKPGCHLCEEAREVLLSVRLEREFELAEVDITLDPGLNREYGERIPVIAVDGEDAFEYVVDRQALQDRLDRVIS
ncbi:MAG TPA: glutaredoxin family protein [Solirubrobacterales bacterium]|nr:glutaredoxin family protein [Solirubrobacterales bacterium]